MENSGVQCAVQPQPCLPAGAGCRQPYLLVIWPAAPDEQLHVGCLDGGGDLPYGLDYALECGSNICKKTSHLRK